MCVCSTLGDKSEQKSTEENEQEEEGEEQKEQEEEEEEPAEGKTQNNASSPEKGIHFYLYL